MPIQCPICNHPKAERLQILGKDAFHVECPACGRFDYDQLALQGLASCDELLPWKLSASCRAAAEVGECLWITEDNMEEIASRSRRWRTIGEGADRLLLMVAPRVKSFKAHVTIDHLEDAALLVAKGANEVFDLVDIAKELGYITPQGYLTVRGWERIEALVGERPNSRQAFVAMWFAKEMTDAWENGLRPGVDDTKFFEAKRVDSEEHNGKIDDRIVAEIKRSGLVVADFTGDRGGVYYESGLADGLGIPVVRTCRADWVDKLHFDTRQYNHIVWNTAAELRDRLRNRIEATIVRPRTT